MKDKIFNRLPFYVIIVFLLCLIGLCGIIFKANYSFNNPNNQKVILYLKMQDYNREKPPYYRKLKANGVKSKATKFKVGQEEIADASSLFSAHINKKKNSIYLTINHQSLRNQDHKKVKDPIYSQMIKQVATEQKHPIGHFFMFKVHHKYYAYLALNAGLDDTGTIYRYSFKKKKMLAIGETEDDQDVIAVMNPK